MRTLLSQTEIAGIVARLADQMRSDRPLVLVPILTGSLVFCADLLRRLPDDAKVFPMVVAHCGRERLVCHAPGLPAEGDIWVVDDCIASGRTLGTALARIGRPAKSAVLWGLSTPAPRTIHPTLIGCELDAVNVAGYGTDFGGRYRGCPDLLEFKEAA